MSSLVNLLSLAEGGLLTVDKIKAITGIDDTAPAAELLVKLTILRSRKRLTLNTLTALIERYKAAPLEENFTSACEEVAAAALRISADNKSRQEEYSKKLAEWSKNPLQLGQQVIRRATHSCEADSVIWDRDRTCREENGDLWEDAGKSASWRLCGRNGVEWACQKKQQLIDQEARELANNRPPDFQYAPVPSLECLTCSQNITFTGKNIVDESSLQQAINCSIKSDDEENKTAPPSPASLPAKDKSSEQPSPKSTSPAKIAILYVLIPAGVLALCLVIVAIIFNTLR